MTTVPRKKDLASNTILSNQPEGSRHRLRRQSVAAVLPKLVFALGAAVVGWGCTGAELEDPEAIYTWLDQHNLIQIASGGGATTAGGSAAIPTGGGSGATTTAGTAPTGGAGSPAGMAGSVTTTGGTTAGAGAAPATSGAGTTAGTSMAGGTSAPVMKTYPVYTTGANAGMVCDPLTEIASSCAAAGCHATASAADAGNLDLEAAGYFERMSNMPATACADQLLINTTDFTASLFYTKVAGTQPAACGDPMPSPFGYPAGYEANQECLENWVENKVNGF